MAYVARWLSSGVPGIALLLTTAAFQTLSAATAPSLGTAAAFAVLGGSTVTNTGPTVINGNLGVSPGSAITGFPPGIVIPPGTIHAADAVAAGAQSDNTIAYNALAGQVCNFDLTGQDLGGLTLVPGTYCFSSSAQLTGTLTLNAQGNPNAVFIFQIGSTLTTASNSSVNIINGGTACNVFWQIGSSATLGTNTSFIGNILALTSITLNTGTNVSGRALAQNGAVTLDSNTVSITQCNGSFTAPPTIAKVFGAATVGVGGTTTLSFTINNPNAVPLTGVAFTDTLPSGLAVSTPGNGLTGSCGGVITAAPGSGSVSLSGATLAAGASCTFSINVTGVTAGLKNNSVTVTSTNGGTGNTSSTSVTVVTTPPPLVPPTIAKVFGAATVGVGGTTTLSFTVRNPNSAPLTGIAFTDTLPSGLTVLTPANGLTGSCGGGVITATPGSGSVSLAGATLAAGASCTFSINVTGVTAGLKNNSVTVSSTNGGTGNTSTASVTVVTTPPPLAPPTIAKVFGAATVGVGGTTTVSFTINNPNTAPLTGIAFTDMLPSGLTVSTPGNGLTGSCGGGVITAAPGSGTVSLAGATLAAGASCTFSINVTGITAGPQINGVTVTSTNGGIGNTSTATVGVVAGGSAAPIISKSFGAVSIPLGGSTDLSFTIENPNATVALTGVGFVDTLPAGLVVATPNGITGSCGGGTITAAPGSGSISLMGATLAAGTSCTFSVRVVATMEGALTNTSGNVTSTNGGTGNTASATLTVGAYLISYESNLNVGDSVVNITNSGVQAGNICVNVYTFDATEEIVSCCSCLVTPNGLKSLSARSDLISNPLTPQVPTSIVKKLVASTPVGGTCDASAVTATNLAGGMIAWDTNLHAQPTTPVTYGVTEGPFSSATLSAAELGRVTMVCGFIHSQGSGSGICNACRTTGLGAASQQ
jgi:uncharacterized repeat protein (TIGR01451 family)